jgi:crossover junction endodeoxyribonuclease RuvC
VENRKIFTKQGISSKENGENFTLFETPYKLIALDLSLVNSGYTVFEVHRGYMEVLEFGTIPTDSKLETGKRLQIIGKALTDLKIEFEPRVVVIERVFSRYEKATAQLNKVLGIAEMVFSGCFQKTIPPNTVKRMLTGDGFADKNAVKEAVLQKFPELENGGLDVTDSAGLALCWFEMQKPWLGEWVGANNGD